MKDKTTPLMKQYNQIKAKHPDTLLLFRLGDFFETFNEDAEIAAKVCGITLTKRNNGAAGEMPLAGFPHHQLEAYLPKLVKGGYRVAVCEQLEDPKQAKGIVRRGVVEVVTPGAALYDKLLDSKKNNYLSAVYQGEGKKYQGFSGIAFCDISTGEFKLCEVQNSKIQEILTTINPSEVILSKPQQKDLIDQIEQLENEPSLTKLEPWIFETDFGREALLGHFKTENLKGFGIENMDLGIAAAGSIINYLNDTQQSRLSHITEISLYDPGDFMILDKATRRNLEITFSMWEGSKEGTLIKILDKTRTAMGGRLLKKWITLPLKDPNRINKRLESVRTLKENSQIRVGLSESLKRTGDLERLISKVCTGRANPRDMISLASGLATIPEIRNTLISSGSENLKRLAHEIEDLSPIANDIFNALLEEPTANLGTGGVFRKGYSTELDEYTEAKFSGKQWIKQYQEKERERLGVNSLKVGFNNVFGYYIEITKVHKDKAPPEYERKQTLTNSERYTTPELKEIEAKIFNAEDKISELETTLFGELRLKVAENAREIQNAAIHIATADCILSFAECADEYDYCEPHINDGEKLDIREGRHPVVEHLMPLGDSFTSNDTSMSTDDEQVHIITGPNMAGKSVYLRQVALIVLMGQIGSFVPASKAEFGAVDRIFTRVGAQDNITSGESTFLIEMQEAANIMNNASSKSLILLDEVGRGTATFDGISIAWAIAEYLHENITAKTLFATHYHELNDLAERYERIINYKVEVIEAGDTILFSHRVLKGATDHSFGIHVAQMAGMPKSLVDRAYIIMRSLSGDKENESKADSKSKADTTRIGTRERNEIPEQMSIFEFRDDPLREQILKADLDSITPIDSLKFLIELQKEAKKRKT